MPPFERLSDNSGPIRPGLAPFKADAPQIIDPLTGAKLGGKMAGKAVESLLAADQRMPRAIGIQ